MRKVTWIYALPLALLLGQVTTAGAEEAVQADTTKAAATKDDEEWLNTVWTQVDDMVKKEDLKLQQTVTVAGVRGAEAEFGACAEKYGLTEKTFSFKGHEIERKRGLVLLSDDELTRRQVSALYLKAHMHREFPNTDLFRRVLASIWHQVSSANEVFAVGVILDNKTVMGGTGWAVELAKNFTLPLWVFDQEKKSWFTWKNGDWHKTADPVISGRRFTGSGTRLLSDDGRKAIRALFERSFGS